MRFMNIIKKQDTTIVQDQCAVDEQVVNQEYHKTKKKIEDGLSRPNASTGTPMDELHGAAKRVAQLSNIGDGSKATGGGGIDQGLETIINYSQVSTAKAMIEKIESQNNKGTKYLPQKNKVRT